MATVAIRFGNSVTMNIADWTEDQMAEFANELFNSTDDYIAIQTDEAFPMRIRPSDVYSVEIVAG